MDQLQGDEHSKYDTGPLLLLARPYVGRFFSLLAQIGEYPDFQPTF